MELTKVEKNKALVLKAFETLFNERDYAAGERDLLHLEFHASKARDEVAPKLSGLALASAIEIHRESTLDLRRRFINKSLP